MEKVQVIPEDLQRKFKSKQDLYHLLSIDLRYLLPPIEKCPIHFLKQVLSGEKKVIRKEKVIELIVPRFKELSVSSIWPLVQDASDLLEYFPDYQATQIPDRKYLFAILATFRFDEVKSMIVNARKLRSVSSPDDLNNLIYINKEIYDEIQNVMTQKLTKGRATYLLKRSSKLNSKRKSAKKYPLTIENLEKDREESKEEEEMI